MIPKLLDPSSLLVFPPHLQGSVSSGGVKSSVANRDVWSSHQPSSPSFWAPHACVTWGTLAAQDTDTLSSPRMQACGISET